MSIYQWTHVPFREKDRSVIYVPGIIIGSYTVSPGLMDDCPDSQYTASVWGVSDIDYGVRIVHYTDFKVAVSFAHYLDKHFGSLKEIMGRYLYQLPLTVNQMMIREEIDAKRRHSSIDTGTYTNYIPFNQDDY